MDELRRFNTKRKIKGTILASLSSFKWNCDENERDEIEEKTLQDSIETTTIIDLNMLDNVTSNGTNWYSLF